MGSLLLVLFYGLLQGYWSWKTFAVRTPPLYPLSFEGAQWVTPKEATPQGYFRRDYAISEEIAAAWLQVSASDNYSLYVNGRLIETRTHVGLNVADIHDLTPLLKRGKNVIAIQVTRRSYPGPAQLAVNGSVLDRSGRRRVLQSDASWKVAAYEQRIGNRRWYAEEFDVTHWSPVAVVGQGDAPNPVNIHPEMVMQPPLGQWIGHPEMGVRTVYFEKSVELPQDFRAAWVRMASDQPYTLSLNGTRVAERQQFQGEMDLYDITPLLKTGHNTLGVSIRGDRATSGLLLDGYLLRGETLEPFVKTDAGWTATSTGMGALGRLTAASVLADYPAAPWGALAKKPRRLLIPLHEQAMETARMALTLALVTLILLGLWFFEGRGLQALLHLESARALSLSAAFHLPSLLFTLFLFLLSWDVRYDPSYHLQGRWVFFSFLLLILCKLGLFLSAAWHRRSPDGTPEPASESRHGTPGWASTYGFPAGVLLLTLAGFLVRLSDIAAHALTHDEVAIVQYAESILETGYPFKRIGTLPKLLTTYELLPYPVALSVLLFGAGDLAVRIPALLFGTAVIPLIARVGAVLFCRRVGFLSALIYAFSPWSILWAQNVFYPQQCQLLALATAYLFYRAVESEKIRPGHLYGAAGLFLVTYLTWEASGFLLPAMGMGLLAMKGRDFRWFKQKPLWIALGVVLLAVFFQQARRILYQVPPYLIVGTGRSDISTPSLFFLDPMYDPTFYLKNFFWLENQAVLTLLLIVGIPWIRKRQGLAYLYAILGTLIFMMTHFLSATAVRYGYYAQPFLILSAAAVCIRMLDGVAGWIGTPRLVPATWVKGWVGLFLPAMLVLASQTSILHLYRLSPSQATPLPQTRRGVYTVDYRATGKFLQRAFREGDLIIPVMPHAIEHYSQTKSHYYMDINLIKQIGYDISGQFPGFLDKYTGNPVLRNFGELKDVLERHRRVWFVMAPVSILTDYADPRLVGYIEKNSRIAYESYGARIYLWEK
jgi:4-amino-4-deoxy-L-arabinose transferase-like glycosyltransferase